MTDRQLALAWTYSRPRRLESTFDLDDWGRAIRRQQVDDYGVWIMPPGISAEPRFTSPPGLDAPAKSGTPTPKRTVVRQARP